MGRMGKEMGYEKKGTKNGMEGSFIRKATGIDALELSKKKKK